MRSLLASAAIYLGCSLLRVAVSLDSRRGAAGVVLALVRVGVFPTPPRRSAWDRVNSNFGGDTC